MKKIFVILILYFLYWGYSYALSPLDLVKQQQNQQPVNQQTTNWNIQNILDKIKKKSYQVTTEVHLYSDIEYQNNNKRVPVNLPNWKINVIFSVPNPDWTNNEIASRDLGGWRINLAIWQSLYLSNWWIILRNIENNKYLSEDIVFPIDWSNVANSVQQWNTTIVVTKLYLYGRITTDNKLVIKNYEINPTDVQETEQNTNTGTVEKKENIMKAEILVPNGMRETKAPTVEIYDDWKFITSYNWKTWDDLYSNLYTFDIPIDNLRENTVHYFIFKTKGYKVLAVQVSLWNKISYENFTKTIIQKEFEYDNSNDPIQASFPWTMIFVLFIVDLLIVWKLYKKTKEVVYLQDEVQYYEENENNYN